MKCNSETIAAAFEQHFVQYATEKDWSVPHHVQMWAWAEKGGETFKNVYEAMRKRWQVFRGIKARPSADELWEQLDGLGEAFSRKRLSELTDDDAVPLWEVIKAMADIKRLKDGPSVMAISKFLHFWNPRLFVIVDVKMMWTWVLKHRWIWSPIEALHNDLRARLPSDIQNDADHHGKLGKYLSILLWCGRLAKENPCIVATFCDYVRNRAEDACNAIPLDLNTYEAAAIEWFLLGAVELPPEGVTV